MTWRGIARSVGMNPASLYTYFDSLDDVFTALIADSFERLGAAIGASATNAHAGPPKERLTQLALTYRRWAVEHPAEFNLIFSDQLPGYAAPPGGPTVAAQTSIFEPFATALAELVGVEAVVVPSGAAPPLPDDVSGVVSLWATMHGLVMLEINNHLPFVGEHEAVFVESMERALSSWQA